MTISNLSNLELCDRIHGKLALLGDSADFAKSMTDTVRRTGHASEKQRFWLEKLARRISGKEPGERQKTPVGDLSGVMALFDKARAHLKSPAVVIQMGEQEIRLAIAGPQARQPGTINVSTNGRYGDSTWFGRILKDGQFEASPRVETPAHLVDGLKRFAAEPAKMAADHGRLTGKCCFCNSALTDERSTHVGYGPTCASKWDMPYPKLSEVRREADLFV